MAYQSNQQPYPSSSDSYPPHHHIPTRSHQSSSDSSDSIDQQTIAESTYHPVHPKHLSHTDTYHEDDPYDLHRYSSEKPHNSTSYPTGDFLNHRSQTIQDTEQANDKYPPTHLAAASSAPVSRRPPVWKRIFWDTTPLRERIWNHQQGIGVQDRAYVCYLLAGGMLVALVLELITNVSLSSLECPSRYFSPCFCVVLLG